MDNVATSPQLLIPVIPDTDCYSGTFVQRLNYYFANYLANSTIGIAGLGLVTPEQIESIQNSITSLQNTVNAISVATINQLVTFTPSGSTYPQTLVQPVVLSPAMPDSNYSIDIELICSNTSVAGNSTCYLEYGTKTPTGFSLILFTAGVSILTANVTAREVVNITAN